MAAPRRLSFSPDTTRWIVNNEHAAWRDESPKSDAMPASGTFRTCPVQLTMSVLGGQSGHRNSERPSLLLTQTDVDTLTPMPGATASVESASGSSFRSSAHEPSRWLTHRPPTASPLTIGTSGMRDCCSPKGLMQWTWSRALSARTPLQQGKYHQ